MEAHVERLSSRNRASGAVVVSSSSAHADSQSAADADLFDEGASLLTQSLLTRDAELAPLSRGQALNLWRPQVRPEVPRCGLRHRGWDGEGGWEVS